MRSRFGLWRPRTSAALLCGRPHVAFEITRANDRLRFSIWVPPEVSVERVALADGLAELDQSELRTLFEVIQVEVAFVPDDDAIDVSVTFGDHWQSPALRETSEDWLVPPAVRAPGRIRTCAPASGGRCSIP